MKSVAKQFYARMFPKFCAVALGIGSCFSRAAASKDLVEPAPAKTLAALPWSHVGAKAGAHYQGDGLAVFPTTAGARMRCVFQQLEGEATREGLWLTSIATNAVKDRFRVVVASVGRSVNADASNPLAPSIPVNLEEPRGFELRHSCAAFDTSELCPMRQGTAAVQDDIALDRTGTIKAANKLVRFTRPGLVEEYSVSMDGVRQDFVVLQRTAGAGELAVRLAVSGAKVEPAAGGARLVLENSGRKIAYSRLRVTDATGKELGARMEVEAGSTASDREADVAASRQSAAVSNSEVGGALPSRRYAPMLAVLVKDADAVYPVRIDPTFSDANWISVNPSIPGADSYVNAAVADSSGNLYIGGDFTLVGEVIANRIAKWDGSHWSPLGSGMDGSVYALAVSGSEVYAGGFFTTAGGRAANYIAKWNGSSWSALGSGMGGWVSALAVSGNDLYAAGNFTWAGGSAANGIAKWDGTSWSALGSGMDGWVSALAVSGSDVYAGGNFTMAGGSAANGIAKWDGTSWSALGSGIDASGFSPGVFALVVSGSNVYAGGAFTMAGGSAANNIAKWDGSSWTALGSGLAGGLLEVSALAVSGDEVYAGGNFWTAGGSAANGIAKWDGTSWSALGSGIDGHVLALAVSGSNVYAGGGFTTAGGSAANGIAKWDGSSWTALGYGLNGGVGALAVSGSDVYAGGPFTTAGSTAANHIAKWSGSTWTALGSGMDNPSSFPDDIYPTYVLALAVSGSDLYAGGYFTTAGGSAAANIAKWNGSNWTALGSGMGGPNPFVYALAVSGSDLYAGGAFTTAGGSVATNIAKWNGSSWSALGSGIGGPNPYVYALAVSGSDLYAAGSFTMAGGSTAANIAKWNGSSWTALGSGIGSDTFPWVYALAVSGSDVYAGGRFTMAGGSVANNIAKWDGSSWSALGSGMNAQVSALAVSGSDVYAGGNFTMAGGSAANGIAKWNGSSWSALGSGMGGHDSFASVSALVVSGSDLYAGGGFTTAGGKVSAYIARAYLLTLPALSVLRSGTDVIVSWSSADTVGFALEQASTLSAPASWVTNTASITDDGTNKSVSLLATTSPQFFRLRR